MAEKKTEFKPTEAMLEAARAALINEAGQQFWSEVETRLDEYTPEITPRATRQE